MGMNGLLGAGFWAVPESAEGCWLQVSGFKFQVGGNLKPET